MNRIAKHSRWFNDPRALWHVHTDYTDGELSIPRIMELAAKRGIRFIFFAEHIQREPTYSLKSLIEEVNRRSVDFGMEAHVGVEAKILRPGVLDVTAEDGELAEAVFVAEHSFPPIDKREYVELLVKAIPLGDCWAHPGLYGRKRNFSFDAEDIERIRSALLAGRVAMERSLKYPIHDDRLASLLADNGMESYIGVDFHREDDFERIGL